MNAMEAKTLARYRGLFQVPDHATSADWARVLATFSLFAGISKRRLRKLVQRATVTELAPGDTIVTGGAQADSLYLILGGTARTLGESRARALRIGDYVGDIGLRDGGRAATTVVATAELQVMRLSRQSVLRVVSDSPRRVSINSAVIRAASARAA